MPKPSSRTRNAQAAVFQAVDELRQVDARLTKIRKSLPMKAIASAELSGVLEVVQTDLLADAIDTLELVAGHGAVSG